MEYEILYLIGASKETDLEKIKAEVMEIIISEGGQFLEKEVIEKRKLAYRIKHETHGIYIARRFEMAEPEKIQVINKKLNLYTGILRFMISKASELPELTSKEEREAALYKIKTSLEASKELEAAKEIEKEKEGIKKESIEEKRKIKEKIEDDIDKKLEEILNI